MDDFHFYSKVGHAIAYVSENCADQERRRELQILKAEIIQRTKLAAFKPPAVFTFAFPAPGYITLGVEGQERTLRCPDLDGLAYAWEIFLNGVAAGDALHATSLLRDPGRHPGNALRNAITKAADWVERTGGCPALAVAMRSPAMSITDAGDIRFTPPKGLRIVLCMT